MHYHHHMSGAYCLLCFIEQHSLGVLCSVLLAVIVSWMIANRGGLVL